MRAKLLHLVPGVRWIPHDGPAQDAPSTRPPQQSRPRLRFSSKAPSTSGLGAARAQEQSIFFARLPLELRREVYAHVVGSETVHLTLAGKGQQKRAGHFVCRARGAAGECNCRVKTSKHASAADAPCLALASGLGVVTVCRRMHAEAVPYLYTSHAFSLLHTSHLAHLAAAIPQPDLHTIRTVNLRWAIRGLPYLRRGPSNRVAYREDTAHWEHTWALLAAMQGLRNLRVVLVDLTPQGMWESPWLELEEQLLQPVKTVTRPACFDLVLPYPSCRVEWDMGQSNVVLRRPERAS